MESNKFNAFMELVQKEARKKNSQFFISSGEGHDLITKTVEGEDLFGWLIPMDRTTEFIYEKSGNHFCEEKWERFEIFAIWKLENGIVSVHFQEF